MSVMCNVLPCNCPLQVVNWSWCIFSWVLWVSGGGCQWEGAGLGTVVYKACALTRASLEEQRVKENSCPLFFLLFPSSCSPVCALESCPRISTQPWTPQRWGLDAPLLCWRQEETPKVSRGWAPIFHGSFFFNCQSTKWVRGGKSLGSIFDVSADVSTLNPNQL